MSLFKTRVYIHSSVPLRKMLSLTKTMVQKRFLVARRMYYEAVVAKAVHCHTVNQSAVGYKTVHARSPWELWSMTTPLPRALP